MPYIFAGAAYLLVFVSLLSVFRKIKRMEEKYIRGICVMTVLCIIHLASSALQFIMFRPGVLSGFHLMISEYAGSLVYGLDNLIFVLVMHEIWKMMNFRKKSRFIAIFIGIAVYADSIFIVSNPLHFLIMDYIQVNFWPAGPKVLVPVYHAFDIFLILHKSISVLLFVVIIVCLFHRFVQLSFLYASDYFAFMIYLLAMVVLGACYDFSVWYTLKVPLHVLMLDLVPAIMVHFVTYQRPLIIRKEIRYRIFDELDNAILVFDSENSLADSNKAAYDLFGLEFYKKSGLTLENFLRNTLSGQIRKRSNSTREEIKYKSSFGDTHIYSLDYCIHKNKYEKVVSTILMFHDITESKKLYAQMERVAMTDPETGLASAALLKHKITEINIYRKFPYSAVACNINALDIIADCFGEESRKAAEIHVCELLKKELRSSDFAAIDNGNIIVLLPDTQANDAERIFDRFTDVLKEDHIFNFLLSLEYGVAAKENRDSDMDAIIEKASNEMNKKKVLQSSNVQKSIVESLKETLKASSFETATHSERVCELCEMLGKKLGLSEKDSNRLKLLANFHDIGELSVPEYILTKPEALTKDERQIMNMHTLYGFKIAKNAEELSPIANDILCHHERWDGTGYPNGYAEKQIPLLARVLAVCDSYDVMTNDKNYKKAISKEEALAEIKENRGKQFDPEIVDAFIEIMEEQGKKKI